MIKEPMQIPYANEDMENVRNLAVYNYRKFINDKIKKLMEEISSIRTDKGGRTFQIQMYHIVPRTIDSYSTKNYK